TSNRKTGACPPDRVHPIGELDAAGVLVTLDADDPAMFGCSLQGEYELVEATLGPSAALRFARNGIVASFASSERKAALLEAFDAVAGERPFHAGPHALRRVERGVSRGDLPARP
ncbi:MAG: hypothetical protein JO359_10780, partial [Candidatus Eremiobacteraeota bacterium]|nr:hypothetical protein [Candidatus Eremiobacteraeota bacterium]